MLLAAGCASAKTVRFATFNSALSKPNAGQLLETLRTPDDPQARAVAEVVQRVRPDVLLLQEFDHGGGGGDYDPDGEALRLFQANYLGVGQSGGKAIHYEYVYLAPSNTGLPTGVDLNGDGLVAPCPGAEVGSDAYAADCHGWGRFPGQYAFVVLSKYPIDRRNIRTFQKLLWKDLPGNHQPPDYYSDAAKDVLRLSSKNHVDVPILINKKSIHVLAAHPTPPVFDGPENRNGRRNYDEIGMWNSYLTRTRDRLPQLVADNGKPAAFPWTYGPFIRIGDGPSRYRKLGPKRLLILGDLNADPHDGESAMMSWTVFTGRTFDVAAVEQLTFNNTRDIRDLEPKAEGGRAASASDGGANVHQSGDPAADTADWDDAPGGPGNLRVDYVLPSVDLKVVRGGVFWPTPDAPLVGTTLATVEKASDHRLVWIDIKLP